MSFVKANAKLAADTLEHTCNNLRDVLEELDMDPALAEDINFCCELDHHILFCTECFYWFLPSLIVESPENGEDICESCLNEISS